LNRKREKQSGYDIESQVELTLRAIEEKAHGIEMRSIDIETGEVSH
jgi:hypothetical protein